MMASREWAELRTVSANSLCKSVALYRAAIPFIPTMRSSGVARSSWLIAATNWLGERGVLRCAPGRRSSTAGLIPAIRDETLINGDV